MPELTLRHRGRRGDRGAVAALVAVLLSGGVLLGMGALTVDIGLIYAEREELQSGADAAAIAVAKVCAANNDACERTLVANLAGMFARVNARDGSADATVCGRVISPGQNPIERVTPCAAGVTTSCIDGPPAAPQPYVEVRTSTRRSPTETALPPVFAGAVTGTDGVTVAACSRVSWGPVRQARIEPAMAISKCQFDDATSNGRRYQPRPTSTHQASPSSEVTLRWFPPGNGGSTCGRFGWLANTSSCRISVTENLWYDGRTNSSIQNSCAVDLEAFHDSKRPVPVAIFDAADTPGHDDQFHVVGIAMFVITGWYRSPGWPDGGLGHDHLPELEGVEPCSGSNRFCVYGYFTTQPFRTGGTTGNVAGTLGDPHYGAVYVRTIG